MGEVDTDDCGQQLRCEANSKGEGKEKGIDNRPL
jgi:hypothetical protein